MLLVARAVNDEFLGALAVDFAEVAPDDDALDLAARELPLSERLLLSR